MKISCMKIFLNSFELLQLWYTVLNSSSITKPSEYVDLQIIYKILMSYMNIQKVHTHCLTTSDRHYFTYFSSTYSTRMHAEGI